ncbi:hypothetical protein VFPBJ_06841 [Purpureocillium lilacinum]|uniref:Uncharacterized protein n=1 Tax=Purpureocillium lilacinum TaxID=33203 RepID=A0A179GMW0_PURLI|nr:hypothetical protein VFPBJ_06841 [Purpureocillium lilacinum]
MVQRRTAQNPICPTIQHVLGFAAHWPPSITEALSLDVAWWGSNRLQIDIVQSTGYLAGARISACAGRTPLRTR